ncbi:MAG: GNAT family N-acetyltransferase, partial [Verrucomicrobiota bacterium]
MTEPFRIRPYQPGDESGAFHVCLRTGDHGAEGESIYRGDPDALARIYVDPYFRLEPELALVAEDRKGICGYALGTLDSRRFFKRYDTEIRPAIADAFPRPKGPASNWSRVEETHHLYHEPDYFCPEPYELYPSHLHIDLLPRAQGCGLGRRLIEHLVGLM